MKTHVPKIFYFISFINDQTLVKVYIFFLMTKQASQKLEESLLIGSGVVFVQIFEAMLYDGFGDKIKLPPSCFTKLSDQGALDKGPMYFRLSKVDASPAFSSESSQNKTQDLTHSGVMEFTASEGYVELPSHVWNNLFHENDIDVPLIEVRYVTLPKGTYAQLQPIGLGFIDIPNHKAVLETSLRKHSTLSQGDIITVKHGEHGYNLRILELKPSSSVSVIDTDVDVDIMEPDYDSTSNSMNQHALIPLLLGKVQEGMVDEGKFQYYKFSVDDALSEKVASGDFNLEVKVETGTGEGDTDVYLSRYPVIFPTEQQYEWSSHVVGSNILVFGSKDITLTPGTYSVGVFGFKGSSKFHISVATKSNTGRKLGEKADLSSQIDFHTVECQNCKRLISSRSVMIHEAYCIRHNIVCRYNGCGVVLKKVEAGNHLHCDKCGEGLQKQEMEKHMKVFHQPLYCSCGVMLEKKEMVISHDYNL